MNRTERREARLLADILYPGSPSSTPQSSGKEDDTPMEDNHFHMNFEADKLAQTLYEVQNAAVIQLVTFIAFHLTQKF